MAALALAALVACAPATGQIHRCSDAGGVVYTDRPCGDGAETSVIVAMSPAAGIQPVAYAPPETAARVSLGMSPKLVHETLGRPHNIRVEMRGTTLTEYWTYRGGDMPLRVAFRYGRVAAVTP